VGQYETIAIIEYEGSIRSAGESQGHYICDVKDKSSKLWFKTNDNSNPIPIRIEDVSKLAYVILYKRVLDQ
jgi:uncharacterized UBP type Zn finger protein